MCGIAGIWKLDGSCVDKRTIELFTNCMKHRGPDGEGFTFHHQNSLALGHRRLSILDLSDGGKQPMSTPDGRYTITYNGEIYNFAELRDELIRSGFKFRSNTDTEVILYAFQKWGLGCLDKFNGMWAFAIWDEVECALVLARDRFGIKPLYYSFIKGRTLAFASETLAFRYLEGYERRIDDKLCELTIKDEYSLEGLGYTIFAGINQILPGHYAICKPGDDKIVQKRWWNILANPIGESKLSFNDAAEYLRELLVSSCRYRLISDVPLATALSGGLDSSTVFAMVQNIHKTGGERVNLDSQRAFSAVFPGLMNDEKAYVDIMMQRTGIPVTWIETNYVNLGEQIENDTRLMDAISGAPVTAIAAIYKGMRNGGVTVSLDGHGVDEMLYGYKDMVSKLYYRSLWMSSLAEATDYGDTLVRMYHPEDRNAGTLKIRKQLNGRMKREKSLLFRLRRQFVSSDPYKNECLPLDLPSLGEGYDFSNMPLEYRLPLFETFQHTLPALFRNFDRASMMNGVEIRMPFMDYRVVEFLFTLRTSYKLGSGLTKRVLRRAMHLDLPDQIVNRTFKVGISSPSSHWFNNVIFDWLMDNTQDLNVRMQMEAERATNGLISDVTLAHAWKLINLRLISN